MNSLLSGLKVNALLKSKTAKHLFFQACQILNQLSHFYLTKNFYN